jgi:hypothetical protein
VSGAVTKRELLKRLVGRGRTPAAAAAPAAWPTVPFHLESCTRLEPATPEEQEAFNRHIDTYRTRAACWAYAPFSDWMLDLLRTEFHHVEITPERELRTFALECLVGLSGADAEPLRELLAIVRRRIERKAALEELAAVQRRTQAFVTPGGVQGLPRLSLHAAGALAAWHTATPNPYNAAFWTSEFAALHVAFAAVRAAAGQHPPSAAPVSWEAAYFDRAHPEVGRAARAQARRALAVRLRRVLPQPFPIDGVRQQRPVS